MERDCSLSAMGDTEQGVIPKMLCVSREILLLRTGAWTHPSLNIPTLIAMADQQCQRSNWSAKHKKVCPLLQKGDFAAAEKIEQMYLPYMQWQMRSMSQRMWKELT